MLRTVSVILLLLQLLVKVNCQMTPAVIQDHTATFIGNKLYILGGINVKEPLNEFLCFDFSGKFNTQNPLLVNLTSNNPIPAHYGAASVKGGANNNTLFLYGGSPGDNSAALVYTFDPQSNTRTKITRDTIVRKRLLTGIIDYNGKMYLWGGRNTAISELANDMLILDTIHLSWGKGNSVGAPSPRDSYGAVFLPDNNILYMGGFSNALNEIYLYDTINDNWSIKNAPGIIPSNRDYFSVVLGLDGQQVIIFGGSTGDGYFVDLTPEDSLYVLNLIDYEWHIPKKVSGKIPSSRIGHKANVIGKYMVVSFGRGYNRSIESDILLLDISNNYEFIWTDYFISSDAQDATPSPDATQPPNAALQSSQTNHKPVIIGVTIGICSILLGTGSLLLYKRVKSKKKNVIPTPGGEEDSNYNNERLAVPTKRDLYNQEQVQSSINRGENATNHEPITISAPIIKKSYNDEKLSLQNINDLKNEIRQEIKNEVRQEIKDKVRQEIKDEVRQEIKNEVKQEIIQEMLQNLQNNVQASNIRRNND